MASTWKAGRQLYFFTLSLQEWLNANATSNLHHISGPLPWNHVFLFGIWLLWKDRNSCIFKNKNPNHNLGKEIVDCASEYFFYANNSLVMTKRTIPKSIKWEKPRVGWLTLNIDVSTTSNSGLVGRGGLIRDEKGDWVTKFVRRIGNTTRFMAEL